MKIAIVCQTMEYLSGSPLYNYTLALELNRKGHEVTLISFFSDNHLKQNLEKAGVKCKSLTSEHYDLTLVSQRNFPIPSADKIVHIVHSEYECETPRDNMEHYVAIRQSIKDHLVNEHGIPKEKITVIHNGVDLELFASKEKPKRDFIKVVIPATIDHLRQKFFDFYTSRASEKFRIYFYGKQFGGFIPQSPYIEVHEECEDIHKHIQDADIVAGILLGRVNLEARATDTISYIHNPDNPEDYYCYYPLREDFEENHDIKKVAEKLCQVQITDKSQ